MDYIEFCNVPCNLPFYVIEMPMGVSGGKDKEDIDCPYCGRTVNVKMTDGFFRTNKMKEKEIAEYFSKKEN